MKDGLVFKVACEAWELEQVHRLNYRTFVEEIPQHSANAERSLIDRHLDKSTCFVCLEAGRVVGMVAICAERPFSLDGKLEDLDAYLPTASRPCEVRLLAVERDRRRGRIFSGLLRRLLSHSQAQGYDVAVISAAASQERLYRHLGFEPFGPPLGTAGAPMRGMYLTWDRLSASALRITARRRRQEKGEEHRGGLPGGPSRSRLSLQPGPVEIHPSVQRAFAQPAISHRGTDFRAELGQLRSMLSQLVGASQVEFLLGSGTLANDAVAAQLTLAGEPGLILTNGEFGERLTDHARRFALAFEVLKAGWGEELPWARILEKLRRCKDLGWLWCVHCETSTGVLNDLPRLKQMASRFNLRLVLDCISSLGTVPVDLQGVYLATGTSGKGLASYPGLSMVFHHHQIVPSTSLPRYLDLGGYAVEGGIPFTHSSNLVLALKASLSRLTAKGGDGETACPGMYDRSRILSRWLRSKIESLGYKVLVPEDIATPAVLTLTLPADQSSVALGESLERRGFSLSYRSAYLVKRNWLQIALMGEVGCGALEPFLETLKSVPASSGDRAAGRSDPALGVSFR